MLAYFPPAIDWKHLFVRTVRESLQDDAQSLAAQLAYYFFLALFPTLLCLIALASLFPLENLADDVSRLLAPMAPPEMTAIIHQQMLKISRGGNAGLVSLGLLGAIWSSSAAMTAIMHAMNRAYGIDESRPWWKAKLTAILLTIGLALFILISFTLVVAGPEIAGALARRLGLGGVFVTTWTILQWPVAFGLVATGIGFIYAFAPDADRGWAWITPGSLLATLLWLVGSLGFRYYAVNFGSYQATYGAIGGVILLLLWFYLTGLSIVAGAEMDAEVDRASPWGAAAAQIVPGRRRAIGPAAARAHASSPRSAESRPEPQTASPPAERPSNLVRIAALVALAFRWRSRQRGE